MNLHNKNRSQYHIPSNETNILDNFKRKCKYVVARFNSKIERAPFEIPDDPSSKGVFDVIIKEPDYAEIGAEFTRIVLDENLHKVSFEGPSLFSTCTIPLSKEENFEREFGYIQTSKMLFYERELEKLIIFSDFYTNLMHDQEEVLDSTGENNPFYSTDSYFKVPAGHKPPHSIEIKLIDYSKNVLPKMCNNVTSQTSSNKDWGCPIKHEIHQQFFVYLVMRYKENNKWEYKVLFSFDWFIYLKWVKKINKSDNMFAYNCGLKEHTKPFRTLPKWIYSEEFYPCNQDQFYYSVYRGEAGPIFNIVHYPESIYKHKLKIIYENLYKIISNMKNEFANFKLNISNISNAKKLCEKFEIEDLETNIAHIESMNLGGNNVCENLFKCIGKMKLIKSKDNQGRIGRLCAAIEEIGNYGKGNDKEKDEFRKKYRNIAEGVNDLSNRIKSIDLENNENCESSESISSKVNKLHNCIQVMDSIEDEFYKGIKCLILTLGKLCKEFERRDDKDEIKSPENYESVTLEIGKVNDLIENMDLEKSKFPTIHDNINSQIWSLYQGIEILNVGEQVCKDIESFLLKINTLCEYIKIMEREENEFIKHYRSIRQWCIFTKRIPSKICKFPKIYVLKKCIKRLSSIMRQLFKHITSLFREEEKLKKDVEKLNSENEVFSKNFTSIFLTVKKLFKCIEFMDLERYNYRDNFINIAIDVNRFPTFSKNIDLEDVEKVIESLLPKVEKLRIMKNKFCQCNFLTKMDLNNKLKNKIKRRNEEERY